jgi:hypothetical protein
MRKILPKVTRRYKKLRIKPIPVGAEKLDRSLPDPGGERGKQEPAIPAILLERTVHFADGRSQYLFANRQTVGRDEEGECYSARNELLYVREVDQ